MSGDTYELDIWNLYLPRYHNTKLPHYACVAAPKATERPAHWDGTNTLASKLTLGLSIYTTTTASLKWIYDYSAETYLTNEPSTTYTYTYTLTTGTEVTVTNTLEFYGRAFYPAMSMVWKASDNASLDPPWPTLTSDVLMPSWAPREPYGLHPDWKNKGEGHDYRADDPKPATMHMKIAILIIAILGGIIVLAILFIMWRRIRRGMKERKERREKGAAAEYSAGTAQGLEMSDMGSTASLHESGAVAENVMPLEGEEPVLKKKGTRMGRWWRRNTTAEGAAPRVDARERELPLAGPSSGRSASAV